MEDRGVDDLAELSLHVLGNGKCSNRGLRVPFREGALGFYCFLGNFSLYHQFKLSL